MLSFDFWTNFDTSFFQQNYQKGHKSQTWSNFGRKLIENWSKIDRKLIEKLIGNWSKIDRKSIENWSKNGHKLVKSWSILSTNCCNSVIFWLFLVKIRGPLCILWETKPILEPSVNEKEMHFSSDQKIWNIFLLQSCYIRRIFVPGKVLLKNKWSVHKKPRKKSVVRVWKLAVHWVLCEMWWWMDTFFK